MGAEVSQVTHDPDFRSLSWVIPRGVTMYRPPGPVRHRPSRGLPEQEQLMPGGQRPREIGYYG